MDQCVWYGICHLDDKYCEYKGPPQPLDPEGISQLTKSCSHLLPSNYKHGQEVLTCCDSKQVIEQIMNKQMHQFNWHFQTFIS